jgi:hypothetical protein
LPKARLSWRTHLLVILAFTLLSLILTWPLAPNFDSHVPGNGADDPPLTWNLWWVRYALLEVGTNPFDSTYLFYPLGINLAFYTLTVLNGLLSIPLQAVFGLVPASNILLLSSFVLSGYGAFLLALHLLGLSGERDDTARCLSPPSGPDMAASAKVLAAFTAGLLYAFASSKLFYAALGQWNIASSQWIPFYILYLFKMGDQPRRWRYTFMATLFLLFQAYAELTYASFLAIFTLLWALWQAVQYARAGRTRSTLRLLGNLVTVGLIVALGLAPVLAMMIPDMLSEGDIFVEGAGFADAFSADLLGYLIPTELHPLLGSLPSQFQFDHTVGQHIFLGFATAALAAVGAIACWRRSAVRFWLLSTVVFWLLTLGPTLRINGHDTGLPLPFALVAWLPFFKGNRYPSRYSVLLVLSLAMLVAFGVAAILRSQPQRKRRLAGVLGLLLVVLLLFEHLSTPLPLSDMRIPAVYEQIAAEMPGEYTLLDIPVAWRNGFRVTGTQDPIIMFEQYYQTVHGKPVLAGNTSRNPPLKFQYFTEAPVINSIIALETGYDIDSAVVEQDLAMAPDVLRFFDIGVVVIHPEQAGDQVGQYLEDILPVEELYRDSAAVAYRVNLPPWPEQWTIRPGEGLAGLSFAEGWGVPGSGIIWAQRPAVRLLVPLNGESQHLRFRAYAPGTGQQVAVRVNGLELASYDMVAGWSEYELAVPADVVHEGMNEVWLRFSTLYPASQVQVSPRAIGQTGDDSPVNLVVQSAGQEVGDFAHIYVDGRDVAPNELGYNVAVLHPETGAVEQTAVFDTHLVPGASGAFADFLKAVPTGRIVAVAVADEASRLLGPEAVEAMRTIGAAGDLQDRFRWGHALVGVKGAPSGTALEGMDWMRPVTLVVGEGATEPDLAAAFSIISFTTQAQP